MQAITFNHLHSSGVKIFKSKEQSKKLAKSLPAHDDFDPTSFSCVSQFSPGHVFVLRASSRRPSSHLRRASEHSLDIASALLPCDQPPKNKRGCRKVCCALSGCRRDLLRDSSRCCESLAFLELRQLQRHTTDKCNTGKAASA